MSVGTDQSHRGSKRGNGSDGFRLNRLHSFLLGVVFSAIVLKTMGWGREPPEPEPSPKLATTELSTTAILNETKPLAETPPSMPAAAVPEPEPEPEPEEPLSRTEITHGEVKPGQFISRVFQEAGVEARDGELAILALKGKYDFRKSRPGHRYEIERDRITGELVRFRYEVSPKEVYEVSRPAPDRDFEGRQLDIETHTELIEVNGEIQHSLYEAFIETDKSMQLAALMTDALKYDIDFFHDTRPGDRFRLFVDKVTANGQLVGYGRLWAAEYHGAAGSPVGVKRLYYYKSPRIEGYFDQDGEAARRAFLRSPLQFTRISSAFGYREHPILHRRHFHGGVDYAAPMGTPVHSVADGKVIFSGTQGAAGKMIKIQHVGGYQSLYLHLSARLVQKGQRVRQNTLIGRVGSTGRSTGPHLDFRLKKDGRYINPRQHVAPRSRAISKRDRTAFLESIRPWQARFQDS